MIARWLTIKEAAIYANVSKRQIKRHVKEGRLLSMDFEGRKKVFIEPQPRKGQVLPNTATILRPLSDIDRPETQPIHAAPARILWHNALRRAKASTRRYRFANAALIVFGVGLLGLASFSVLNTQDKLTAEARHSQVLAHQLTQISDELEQATTQLAIAGSQYKMIENADGSALVDQMLSEKSEADTVEAEQAEYQQLLVSFDELQLQREDDLKQMIDLQTELNAAQARIHYLENDKAATIKVPVESAPVIKAAVATQ